MGVCLERSGVGVAIVRCGRGFAVGAQLSHQPDGGAIEDGATKRLRDRLWRSGENVVAYFRGLATYLFIDQFADGNLDGMAHGG